MHRGQATVSGRLAVEADAVAAALGKVQGTEGSLSAANRLAGSALLHPPCVVGDGLALLLALSLLGELNPITVAWVALTLALLTDGRPIRRRLNIRLADDLPELSGRLAVALLILVALDSWNLSLQRFARISALSIVLILVARSLTYAAVRSARKRGVARERVLMVGISPGSRELSDTIRRHPEFGMSALGFVAEPGADNRDESLTVLGDVTELERIIGRLHVSRVIVALDSGLIGDATAAVERCRQLSIDTYVIPPLASTGLLPEKAGDDVLGLPLRYVPRAPLDGDIPAPKRLLDLAVSGLSLIVTAPVFALAAFGVRLSSPGPIFFRQERIGQDGRPFDVLKFRTMCVNNDSDTTWTVRRDGRVTAIGRVLRKSSIDELPQLINVLKGEMSLIGPRPERPHFVSRFATEIPSYALRHRSTVGITGWAQVHGLRGDTSIADRIHLDNYYIEHWSMWMDLVIMLRTAREIIRSAIGR